MAEGLASRLHTYSTAKRLAAVESGAIGSRDALFFVGGLGDVLNATPYIAPLSRLLEEHGWALVQVLTSVSRRPRRAGSNFQVLERRRLGHGLGPA